MFLIRRILALAKFLFHFFGAVIVGLLLCVGIVFCAGWIFFHGWPFEYTPWVKWHPQYFMTVKGHIDSALLKDKIQLQVVSKYKALNRGCNTKSFGTSYQRYAQTVLTAGTDANGNYNLKVPLDYFKLDKCNWVIDQVNGYLKGTDTDFTIASSFSTYNFKFMPFVPNDAVKLKPNQILLFTEGKNWFYQLWRDKTHYFLDISKDDKDSLDADINAQEDLQQKASYGMTADGFHILDTNIMTLIAAKHKLFTYPDELPANIKPYFSDVLVCDQDLNCKFREKSNNPWIENFSNLPVHHDYTYQLDILSKTTPAPVMIAKDINLASPANKGLPRYFITLKGHIDPDLAKRIQLKICDFTHNYIIKPDIKGNYKVKMSMNYGDDKDFIFRYLAQGTGIDSIGFKVMPFSDFSEAKYDSLVSFWRYRYLTYHKVHRAKIRCDKKLNCTLSSRTLEINPKYSEQQRYINEDILPSDQNSTYQIDIIKRGL